MRVEAFEINGDSYIVEKYVYEETEVPDNLITYRPAEGLYKPRWNGTEWVEGLSAEEIEAIKNQTKEPSELEKLKLRQDATENALLFLMDMGGM